VKHEEGFQAAGPDYVAPFITLDDPYEASKEEVLRAKWLSENKILHGDFKPS